jgi:YHS domain-containing protein
MKSFSLVLVSSLLLACACAKAPPPAPASLTPAVASAGDPPLIPIGTKMKCPVSGDPFTVDEKTQQLVYQGKRYAFCCSDCPPEFRKHPEKFAKK